ncbi:GNAT family N-acetyltransferase [Shinella sp. M31]|uniref:GNAT family N-acetyltransferase n=1 Tax=Shinella sp. M31 TaxID=3368615 RepID=UPI003BA23789
MVPWNQRGRRPEPPVRLCWMAENGGAVVGHAQLDFDWRNGNVVPGRVAIAPGMRGRGCRINDSHGRR